MRITTYKCSKCPKSYKDAWRAKNHGRNTCHAKIETVLNTTLDEWVTS